MDTVSSFFYSYSYCAELDECLQDSWNYYNRACNNGGWKAGYTLDLDADCKAEYMPDFNCPGVIKPNPDIDKGTFQNFTKYLSAGTKCKITVDAADVATLFVLANNTNLGTTYNHYRVG